MDDSTHPNPNRATSPSSHQHGRDGGRKPSDPQDCSGLTANHCYTVNLFGLPIAALIIDGQERLCLAQISNTLLKKFSYNEIHNRRVALGITCVQCTPVQLEILRRANAMPVSSRRCGMINNREAERLCKSFLTENAPPKLPDNFSFDVYHECTWGCRGAFLPSRYNSSRAKCIRCAYCNLFSSPNKFIFHAHRTPTSKFHPPDGPNFNSWRRHIKLVDPSPSEDLLHAWEDVKAMFNGGSRKRSVCGESSSKLAPSSFGRDAVGSLAMRTEAQRLLPSPPKRSRYEQDPHRDLITPPAAVSVPYPLMPIPSHSLSSSIADTLPEDAPLNSSSPHYPVSAIFPGQLSPPGFRQHPFMELVWGGARAGYPVHTAALWPKTIRMPFASNAGYYQPLVDPEADMHAVVDVGRSPTGTPSKKPHPWDDQDSMKFGSLMPQTFPVRHHHHHHHLPDLRPRGAYYSPSAFRPVLTAKRLLEHDRPFAGAERFLFPTKLDECRLAVRDHLPNPSPHHQLKSHHVKMKPDDDRIVKSPTPSASPKTPKLVIDADDLSDKPRDPDADRTPGSTGHAEADAGASSTDDCDESRRVLEKFRPKRSGSAEEVASPRKSPDILLLGDRLLPNQQHQHHRHHLDKLIKTSRTPSPSEDGEDHASGQMRKEEDSVVESVATPDGGHRRKPGAQHLIARAEHRLSAEMELRHRAYMSIQQKYRDNQGPLNHFSRRILSSHGACLD